MPKPKKAKRFGGSPGHHNLMMSNLATELIRHGRIRTTHAKAKTVQPLAERMITLAKRGDLHSRRQVLQVIRDQDVVHHLFADVGPAFSERHGGYTRVLKLGPRKGDAAPMALIELVDQVDRVDEDAAEGRSRRRWSLRRRRSDDEAPAATTTVDDTDADEVDDADAEVDDEAEGQVDVEADDGVGDELPPAAGSGAVSPDVVDEDADDDAADAADAVDADEDDDDK